jgi:hypothetical protein
MIACDYLTIQSYEVELPSVEISKLQIINGVANRPSIDVLSAKTDIDPLSRDVLVREDIPKNLKAYIKSWKENELEQSSAELKIEYNSILYRMFYPEDSMSFEQITWSKQSYPYGKYFRVFCYSLSAELDEDNPTENLGHDEGVYDICFNCILHETQDTKKRFPKITAPFYPILIEGVVTSDASDKDLSNYKILKDDSTSSDYLEVEVPVWEKIKARVQHDPGPFSGQFYFPPYNGQKVLLGLWFSEVRIIRNIDWREYTPLPMEGQGNHLVFGTKSDSRSAIQHTYIDNQPRLDISRVLEQDMETISLAEGSIILRTREDKKR